MGAQLLHFDFLARGTARPLAPTSVTPLHTGGRNW